MQNIQNFEELEGFLELFHALPCNWFVCGGWAIDLFLGKVTREHTDVEVGCFRADQAHIHALVKNLQPEFVLEKKFYPWKEGDNLKLPIHEVWCQGSNPRLEILFNEKEDDLFLYRRDTKVTRNLRKAILQNKEGVSFLAPEIVLLYKSKNIQDKDHCDFEAALPLLATEQRAWLKDALMHVYGTHPWMVRL